ncbi:MAG: DMT family transporter [Tenericutes bacterium]|nr:DMT family transporter [Mycoplasmatota bacterium]
MVFILIPVAAGLALAFQSVFYEKVSRDIGVFGTAVMVHFFGLIAAVIVFLLVKGSIQNLTSNINGYTVVAGALGVIVVTAITKSVSLNGVLLTVMLSVVAQMIFAKIIGHFGWFGIEQNPINWMQVLAIFLMIVGVFIYQKS